MAVQCELSNDRAQGPGHGLLRLGGTGLTPGPLAFSLKRNQGTAPFLGHSGQWQATELWHEGEALAGEGGRLILSVGPELVDPIVALPPTVAFWLTLQADDGVKQAATLKVTRPLLGSGAAAPAAPAVVASVPAAVPPLEPAATPVVGALAGVTAAQTEIPEPPEPSPKTLGRWLLATVVLLVLAGGGLYAYLGCLLPGFAPARCAVPVIPPEVAVPPPTPPVSAVVPDPLPSPTTTPPKNCANLGGDACLALADGALAVGENERARQLYQEAARLGSLAANVRLARMYDPEGWSAEQSPASKPDWETAAYWYEEAARGGDTAGRQGAGRLLCRFGASDFERARGLQLLGEAAQQGAEVQALITACGGKP